MGEGVGPVSRIRWSWVTRVAEGVVVLRHFLQPTGLPY